MAKKISVEFGREAWKIKIDDRTFIVPKEVVVAIISIYRRMQDKVKRERSRQSVWQRIAMWWYKWINKKVGVSVAEHKARQPLTR